MIKEVDSPNFDKSKHYRLGLDINSHKVNIDQNTFRKTIKEKRDLSLAKSVYKSNIGNLVFEEDRKEMLKFLLNCRRPKWGGFTLGFLR